VNRVPREARGLSPRAPVFTRDFLLVCLVTLLSSSAHSLVLTAIPLFLIQMGFGAAFVGGFIGAFSMCALIARFPVGVAVDRFGCRAFGSGGAGLLFVACMLYALVPVVPWRVPFTAAVPLLLPVAGIAHSLGFSTYGTSASSFVAYTVPTARRGEAVGYYGILMNVARGLAAGVSLLIVAQWGFSALLGTAAVIAALAAILALSLDDAPRVAKTSSLTAGRFRLQSKVLLPASVSATLAAGAGAALAFVPVLGAERGVANPGIYFTAVALTSIAFRIVAGRAADSYGRFAPVIPGMLLASGGLLLISHASSVETLVLAGVVFGMGLATAEPALQALVIDRASQDQRGSAMATYYAMVDLGVSTGSVVSGHLAPSVGYGGVFSIASWAPIVGMCGFVGSACLGKRRPRRGSGGTA